MAGSAVLGTAAALAYLNAKWRVSNDLSMLSSYASTQRQFEARVREKRVSNFSVLEEHVRNPKIADEIFLIVPGQTQKSWTFRAFYETSLKYASWLHNTHKVTFGEIVALDFMNSEQMLFLITALWAIGASPALINYNLTSKPLIHSVKISTARLLILDPDVAAKALTGETKEAFSAPNFRNNTFPLEIVVLDAGLQSSLNYFTPYRVPDNILETITPADISSLIYTSGTTGMPKAAVISWTKIGVGGRSGANFLNLRPVYSKHPDRYYTCMPLYHTMAYTLGFNMCLQSATTLVIGRKFSASNFWTDVRRSKATVIQYVGETLRYLVTAKPTSHDRENDCRLAFGNGLRPDIWPIFKTRFGIKTIVEIYGMTEGVGATWNINNNDFSDGAIGSQGKVLQFLNRKAQAIVRVDWDTEKPWRDPETGLCQLVATEEVGELLFMLDPSTYKQRFKGYFNNSEATDSKLVWNVLKKGDVYFRCGDVVKRDIEGRLFFSDRIGDTFRWKSENVSTNEVGEVIAHHPALQEVNIYGVSLPHHEGRAGCAAILPKDDALQDVGEDLIVKPDILQSLAIYATNSLPKYAVPLFLRVVKEIPLTGNNKHQKVGLRKQGVDLNAIKEAGSSDRLYWLKPGAGRYVDFTESDSKALEQGNVKL